MCFSCHQINSDIKMCVFTNYGERGGSVVECWTPEREVGGSKPTAAVLCPWARHFTPRKYWLITQEAVAPSRHDWKIVDWDVKPQHKQTNKLMTSSKSCLFGYEQTKTGRFGSDSLNCFRLCAVSAWFESNTHQDNLRLRQGGMCLGNMVYTMIG